MDKIATKIPEEILQRTTNCEFDFNCLYGDKKCLCEVETSIGNDMLEVKAKTDSNCGYCLPFGDTYYCLCPTRNEIYKRYDK